MSLLALIWWSSLVLAGTAMFVMALLVVIRLMTTRSERRRTASRRELVHQLLGRGLSARDELEKLPLDIVADTFVDLIQLVRGEERSAFVAQAAALGVPQYLGRRLRRGWPRERLLAAQSLGQFADPESLALLQGALGDGNPDVRLAAALSLAESGNSDHVRDLVENLGLGSGEDSTLSVSLFRIISTERIDEVKALILDPSTNTQVRLAAIEALAMTGDYSIVPVIANLSLNAADDAVELPRYLRALGLFAHPAGRDAVLDGLGRSTFAARAAAAGAAGRIGLTEAAARLAALLDDEEWWVRFRAAEALLSFGDPGVKWLRELAREGTPRARSAAASMLAEHKMPQ